MRPFLHSLGTPEQEAAIVRGLEEEDEGFRNLPPHQKEAVLLDMRTNGPAIQSSRMVKDLHATVGILCLVKNRPRDLLMWAHYADRHRGCVLEFDGTHDWFRGKQGSNPHPLMGVLHEVKYSSTRPKVSLLDLGKDDLLTKADCWGYEQEWRILLNLKDCTTQTYGEEEVDGMFQVPIEALTGVYLGVNIDSKDREQFLDQLPPGNPVGLFQFSLDEQEFALVARQLNI
jgi:hypothetical protein